MSNGHPHKYEVVIGSLVYVEQAYTVEANSSNEAEKLALAVKARLPLSSIAKVTGEFSQEGDLERPPDYNRLGIISTTRRGQVKP